MEITLPHEVIYDTPHPVPLQDVIDSLIGAAAVASDIGPVLEVLFPGLEVKSVSLRVFSISQASPLREAFAAALVIVYQDKLADKMPAILHDLFHTQVSKDYDSLISLIFIVLVFYSAQFLSTQALTLAHRPAVTKMLDGLIAEISKQTGHEEDKIRRTLEQRYIKGGLRQLLASSFKFLEGVMYFCEARA